MQSLNEENGGIHLWISIAFTTIFTTGMIRGSGTTKRESLEEIDMDGHTVTEDAFSQLVQPE